MFENTLRTFAILGIAIASVSHSQGEVPPAVPHAVEPFSLTDVRLLDGPFHEAMLRDHKYLLSLNPDRFLSTFRTNVGLAPAAEPYGGWEAPDIEERGHSLGHYLSALSLMYSSTGNEELKRRVEHIVTELATCQSNSGKAGFHDGYLSAFPESFIDRVERRQKVWAPWYVLHKILAGLIDANQHCGSAQAITVAVKMADWIKFRVDHLSHKQMQKALDTEHGGMNEALANLYRITGDPKHLALSVAFNHERVLDPLAQGLDQLDGLHANTQIPKVVGAMRQYQLTGEQKYFTIAKTLWDSVALHRTYVIGGNSEGEHFFPPNAFARRLTPHTCETCTSYNMLKLTREMFALRPEAEKMDYFERALYNHILASQDPETGMFAYFPSLKPGHFQAYSTPEDSFWCCVGTGMENHAKYGEAIYSHTDDSLYVNLFIATELTWKDKGLVVRQETQFPESGETTIRLKAQKPVKMTLNIRRPVWAEDGFSLSLNGEQQPIHSKPGSYLTITREWHHDDKVEIHLPMKLRTESLPGASNVVALLYGPVVLAGKLGTKDLPSPFVKRQNDLCTVPTPAAPVFVTNSDELLSHVHAVPGTALTFRTQGLGRPEDVTLIPFYQLRRGRYSVYWKILSDTEWQAHRAALAAEEARRIAYEARLVDSVNPGEQQSETDHNFDGTATQTGDRQGRKWRDSSEWFSYELKVIPDQPVELACTFWGGDGGKREFDLLVDGKVIAVQRLKNEAPGKYVEKTYPIPPELTRGKNVVVVKFAAHAENKAGGVFGVHILKKTGH